MKKVIKFLKVIITILNIFLALTFLYIILEDVGIFGKTIEQTQNIFESSILGIDEIKNVTKIFTEPEIQITLEKKEDEYFLLYNQLDDNGKYIYLKLEENFENMVNGNCRVELGNYLEPLVDNEENVHLQTVFQSAVTAYTMDNHESFVLDYTKLALYVSSSTSLLSEKTTLYLDLIQDGNTNCYAKPFTDAQQVQDALSKVRAIKKEIVSNATGNLYDDCKYVHDYLIDNTQYDQDLNRENTADIYGCLVNNICVCEGYARTYSYILKDMGYNCIVVPGYGTIDGDTQRHAWNIIETNQGYYGIDCTWDDPIITSKFAYITEKEKYRFFMKNDDEFKNSHIPDGQLTEGGYIFKFPEI